MLFCFLFFFFSSRRRHTRSLCDWSSDVCSSDVELGVAEIRPVLAAASVARPKGERAAARHAHWQKIAIAACEQCGRNRVPGVHPMVNAAQYREDGAGTRILLSPRAELALSKVR